MKFVRSNQVWLIVGSFSGVEESLEKLAYRLGYRVGDMCEVLGCSQRHLYGVFMRDIGISPKKWMDHERMVVARRKLMGGVSIRRVTDQLGYSSVVAFSRRFERTHGVPPGRFVKGHKLFGPTPDGKEGGTLRRRHIG